MRLGCRVTTGAYAYAPAIVSKNLFSLVWLHFSSISIIGLYATMLSKGSHVPVIY